MKQWTLHIILVEASPVKVYVNSSNTSAIVFRLFGRYIRVNSDVNALDLATSLLFHTSNDITHNVYLNSLEETACLDLEHVA